MGNAVTVDYGLYFRNNCVLKVKLIVNGYPFNFWMTFSRESVIDIPASSSWCLHSLIMAWNFMGSMLNRLSPQSHFQFRYT